MHEIHFEAAVNYDDALWRAAAESTVDSNYYDIFGHRHDATRETLRAILSALGWNVEHFETIEAERRRRFAADLDCGLPRTSVISENAKWVPLSVAEHSSGEISFEIHLENEERIAGTRRLADMAQLAAIAMSDRRWRKYRLDLPDGLPLGYHI